MPDANVSTSYRIEIDGQPLPEALLPKVLQVIVDDHLLLPDTFEVVLQETDARDVATQAHAKVGAKVVISGKAEADSAPSTLITGEITSLEGEYRATKAPTLVVRGYDQGHRLMHGKRSAVYTQQKCSDIAQAIASRVGLQIGTVQDSRTVFPYVLQANQTDWEFLNDLASRCDRFQVAVTDGKFNFGQPPPASEGPGAGDLDSTNPRELVFGQQDLQEFRPRVTAGGQVAKVTVLGWDMKGKTALTSEQPAGTTSVQLPDTPASIAAAFGSPKFVTGNRPRTRQAVVEDAAKGLAEQLGSAFAEASGIARGNPKLKAGVAVNVSKVAAQFAGRFTLSHTRHVFDKKGYTTHFEVSGRQERTLLGLASGGSGGGGAAGSFGGVQVGLVTDNKDPDDLGRVRVQMPYLGSDFVTDWARVVAPGNGPDRGFVWIPEVQDEVLVAFHHGDISEPYVLGGLWNGKDKHPPIEVDGGKLKARKFVSSTGLKIVLSDESGKEGIVISSKDDSLQIHVDVANKKVVLLSDGGGTVEMKSGGDFTIESQGDVKIKGVNVEVSASASAKLKAGGPVDVEASGVATVKGSQVSLG